MQIGYIEFKSRIVNKENAKEHIDLSIKYFEKAYSLSSDDQRVCLGLAQGYSRKATSINYTLHKDKRKIIAEKANSYFEKAFYTDVNLSYTEKHSNAITAFGYAVNIKNNIRDDYKALKICKKGLEYEPENIKLNELKKDLEYKIDPNNYSVIKFKEKGWIKKN